MLLYFPHVAARKPCYSDTLKNSREENLRKQFKEVIVLELVLLGVVAMIIGISIGFGIGKAKYHQWPIGDLRIDRSDPVDGPHLYLELDTDVSAVLRKKRVVFRVKVKDFIPHE